MVTIGDSFAVVALLGGICLSAWAMILSVALVFPGKANHARNRLAAKPWGAFFIGLLIWATLGFLSLALLSSPMPPAKLLGWIGLLGLGSIAAVGSSGLATLAAERLKSLAPEMTHYAAFTKSAAYIVLAGLVPVLGWFLVVPFLVFASTGAGVHALMLRERAIAESPRFIP
jgi:hypothetical protein